MALKFEWQVLKDTQGRVPYQVFQAFGREHYKLRIWLEGSAEELDQVDKVDYSLHPTFTLRQRSSSDRGRKFEIEIWTWGMFAIQSTINYKNGTVEVQDFYLSYDLPEDDGTNYVLRK